MTIFDEIRRAGLTKQFVLMFLGMLLFVSFRPGDLVLYITVFLWILLMMAFTLVYRRHPASRFTLPVLVLPLIAGYFVLVQRVQQYSVDDAISSDFSVLAVVIAISVTWVSFMWLLVVLARNPDTAKLKNSEKAKHDL